MLLKALTTIPADMSEIPDIVIIYQNDEKFRSAKTIKIWESIFSNALFKASLLIIY